MVSTLDMWCVRLKDPALGAVRGCILPRVSLRIADQVAYGPLSANEKIWSELQGQVG